MDQQPPKQCHWKKKVNAINNVFFGKFCPILSNKLFITGMLMALSMYKNGGFKSPSCSLVRNTILYPFLIGLGIEKILKGFATHEAKNISFLKSYVENTIPLRKTLIYPERKECEIKALRLLMPNIIGGIALLTYFYGGSIAAKAPDFLQKLCLNAPSKESCAFFLYGLANLGKHVIEKDKKE